MDFHQHVETQLQRLVAKANQLRLIQRRNDQQHAVGAQRARLEQLVVVDHEILAQHRQRAGVARFDQILVGTLEEIDIGEHR